MLTADTYPRPNKGWVCFHCGEHFKGDDVGEREAREHFGRTPDWSPLCIERRTIRDDTLLQLSRKARAEAEEFLRRAHESEEIAEGVAGSMAELCRLFKGASSVHDAWCKFESMEGRALAAEAILKAAEAIDPKAIAAAREQVCGPEPVEGVI